MSTASINVTSTSALSTTWAKLSSSSKDGYGLACRSFESLFSRMKDCNVSSSYPSYCSKEHHSIPCYSLALIPSAYQASIFSKSIRGRIESYSCYSNGLIGPFSSNLFSLVNEGRGKGLGCSSLPHTQRGIGAVKPPCFTYYPRFISSPASITTFFLHSVSSMIVSVSFM